METATAATEPDREEETPKHGRLTFEEAGHIYRLNGRLLPSVTQILSQTGYGIDWARHVHMERGSAVHRAIQYELTCGLAESSREQYRERNLYGYVEAALLWMTTARAWPLRVEPLVFSPTLRYAGRVDWIGRRKGSNSLVLVDWKTGASLHRGYFLQSAAYATAIGEMWGHHVERLIIQVAPDGTYKTTRPDDPEHFTAWRAAVLNYHDRVRYGLLDPVNPDQFIA